MCERGERIIRLAGDLRQLTEEKEWVDGENMGLRSQLKMLEERFEAAKISVNEVYNMTLKSWFVPQKLRDEITACRKNPLLWPVK